MATQSASARDILERIDRRIAILRGVNPRVTDRSISLKATGSPDTLRSIRRQVEKGAQRGISTETVRLLASALETTPDWLLTESGPEEIGHLDGHERHDAADHRRTTRIVGYVGAGAEAHYYAVAQGDLDEVPAPEGADESTVAVEIRGDSLGLLFDRWLVFYDDVRRPVTPDLVGRLCVVGLPDDRVLVKKIQRGRSGRFRLISEREPPIEDVEIEWAARVKNMVPR